MNLLELFTLPGVNCAPSLQDVIAKHKEMGFSKYEEIELDDLQCIVGVLVGLKIIDLRAIYTIVYLNRAVTTYKKTLKDADLVDPFISTHVSDECFLWKADELDID